MDSLHYRVSDIAQALRLSERRVQQLVKEGILPASRQGNYNLGDCVRAYEQYLQKRKNEKFEHDEITRQKLRLLKAQAEKAELELEVLKNKYLEAAELEFEWTDLIIKFRARMLNLPGKLVRSLAAVGGDFVVIERILDDEIRDTLTELSKYGKEDYSGDNESAEAGS